MSSRTPWLLAPLLLIACGSAATLPGDDTMTQSPSVTVNIAPAVSLPAAVGLQTATFALG